MKWNEKTIHDEEEEYKVNAIIKENGTNSFDTIASPTTTINKNVTIISKAAVITGNLFSKEKIQLSGTVKGDISCSDDIFIDGVVDGNITGQNITIANTDILGDIASELDTNIADGVTIKGNITAGSVLSNGYIEGNIHAKNDVVLHNNSFVKGMIVACSLESERGATIIGQCNITEK